MKTRMEYSDEGIAVTKEFESFVPFVYDDLKPNRRYVWEDGRRYGYAQWDGSKPKGTLTIGYGHTDAARHPLKCRQGTAISEADAREILRVDMSECVERVNKLVKVDLTQGQFDALVDFEFNSGGLMTKRGPSGILVAVNGRRFDDVPGELMKWVYAKGARLPGLERRRAAEIGMWKRAEKFAEDEGEPGSTVIPDHPAGLVDVKPLPQSKTMWGLLMAFLGTIGSQAKEAADSLESLVPLAPWLGTAFVILSLVGLAWAFYGRWHVNARAGA